MMHFVRFKVIIALYLFCALSGMAQEQQTVSLPIDWQSSVTHKSNNNQFVLHSLATAVGLSESQIKLIHHFDWSIRSEFSDKNQSALMLHLQNQYVTENTEYRGFNLKDWLIPNKLSGVVDLYSQKRNLISYPFEVQTYSHDTVILLLGMNAHDTFDNLHCNFTFSEYSDAQKEQLVQIFAAIDNYRATINYLDALISMSNKQESDFASSPESLFTYRDNLRKALLLAEQIKNQVKKYGLLDEANSLNERLIIAERLNRRYETLFSQMVNNQLITSEKTAIIIKYYFLALQYAQEVLINHDYRDTDFLSRINRICFNKDFASYLQQISPLDKPDLAASFLSDELVYFADDFYEKSDLANALKFYEDAVDLSRYYGFTFESTPVMARIDAAKLGILQSHLQIAAKAVRVGNEELAESYQSKSVVFIKEKLEQQHISQLPDQSDDLIKAYLDVAQRALEQSQYNLATQLLDAANTASNNFYNIKYKEEINEALKKAHYAIFISLVNDAEMLLQQNKIEQSRIRLQQAIDYRQDHAVFLHKASEAATLLSKINQQTAKNIEATDRALFSDGTIETVDSNLVEDAKTTVLNALKQARLKAWANDLEQASNLYDFSKMNMNQHGLEEDSDVLSAFAAYEKQMIERICMNNKFRIEQLMGEVSHDILMKKPDKIHDKLMEVIETAANNPTCNLDVETAAVLYKEYELYFLYQKEYKHIMRLISTKALKDAIAEYLLLDSQISTYELDRIKVVHLQFFEYLASENNSEFTLEAMHYFLQLKEATKLISSMEILSNQNFSAKDTRELQQKLAIMLADFYIENIENEAMNQLLQKLEGDKRFSIFRTNFMRETKRKQKNINL